MVWFWVAVVWLALAVPVTLVVARSVRLADQRGVDESLEPNVVLDPPRALPNLPPTPRPASERLIPAFPAPARSRVSRR